MWKQTITNRNISRHGRTRSCFCGAVFVLGLAAIGATGNAQSPVASVTNIPLPDANTVYSTSLRYNSNGNLYAWSGIHVWEQSGGSFNNIGSVRSDNSADAGPIAFSQDGQTILLSDGAGGASGGAFNGAFFTMPASGGASVQVSGSGLPYTGDALALPTSSAIPGSSEKYLVYQGNSSFDGSSLSVFDATTGSNQVVVANGPGATTSIAVNPSNGRVYLGVGFGANQGNIYSFGLSQIDAACASGNPLDFLTAGKLFNPNGSGSQNGAGMFFDKNGYLFSGGGGITVFRPDGTICYDQPANPADFSDEIFLNPRTNEVLKFAPYSADPTTGTVFNAGQFESGAWIATSGSTGSWNDSANWLLAAVPGGGTANVTFAGTLSTPFTVALDGNQSAGSLAFDGIGSSAYTISRGTGGGALTLGTSAGAAITVDSGNEAISAPLLLAGDLTVQVLNRGALQLTGVGQAEGIVAALGLDGNGTLVLSGTNTFTGGVTVAGGKLELMQPYALPEGASLTVGDPAAFAAAHAAEAAGAPAYGSQGFTPLPEPGCLAILAAGIGVFVLRRGFRLVSLRSLA